MCIFLFRPRGLQQCNPLFFWFKQKKNPQNGKKLRVLKKKINKNTQVSCQNL